MIARRSTSTRPAKLTLRTLDRSSMSRVRGGEPPGSLPDLLIDNPARDEDEGRTRS
jgi:hypothetical protein